MTFFQNDICEFESSHPSHAVRCLLSRFRARPIRMRKYLEQELHLDEPARMKWLTHWLDAGTQAIEDVLARDPRIRGVGGRIFGCTRAATSASASCGHAAAEGLGS
jgi:hypothetical protein